MKVCASVSSVNVDVTCKNVNNTYCGVANRWGGRDTVSFGWGGVRRDCRCLCLHYLPCGGYGGWGAIGSGGVMPTPDCRFLCLHYLPRLHKNPEDFHDGVQ